MTQGRSAPEAFVSLSAALTGFDTAHLRGTGNLEDYHALLEERASTDITARMLHLWDRQVAPATNRDRALRHCILSDPCYGPLARNLIRLWFTGTWRKLPEGWRSAFAPGLTDGDVIPSRTAYTEGLLWPTVGANPPGAKPFGYGMWAKAPRVMSATRPPHG